MSAALRHGYITLSGKKGGRLQSTRRSVKLINGFITSDRAQTLCLTGKQQENTHRTWLLSHVAAENNKIPLQLIDFCIFSPRQSLQPFLQLPNPF